jgi:hypothetical protein
VSSRQKEPKPKPSCKGNEEEPEDFSGKWIGKKALIIMSDNSTVNAKIIGNSKYYLEVVDLDSSKVTYVHKSDIKKLVIEDTK